jgi:hypothetical protein
MFGTAFAYYQYDSRSGMDAGGGKGQGGQNFGWLYRTLFCGRRHRVLR